MEEMYAVQSLDLGILTFLDSFDFLLFPAHTLPHGSDCVQRVPIAKGNLTVL